ncbi:MAG: class A beta-lactamase-related serine hydrolase, partial [Caulobacteraceae bacterium]
MPKVWLTAVTAGIVLLGNVAAPMACAAPTRQDADPVPDSAALEAAFDSYMQASVQNAQFSGTVLVAKDGVPVFRRSYGLASHELNLPNTGETTYQLQSITKPFTAILIMQLQEDGRLNINDRACDYLADCPAAWRAVTLRHLLTHTSGIESYSRLPDWDETLDARTYWRAGAAALMRDRPLLSEPGTRYRYSNTGYDLLGLIAERVSGKPLAQMYRERILGPAGMTHTGLHTSRLVVPNAATGYYSLGSTFISATPQSPTVSYGSGGLFSTVDDLLLWDQALYADRILSAASYARMIADAENNYGLGWEMRTWLGRR